MGKKGKIGKQRKDKYYQLAKEAGYRSRAAFKLIQLNRKFEFLQRSKVTIDLCAAPGGWLQVAQQNMPVPSVLIGVDLVPIKPIPHVIALQEDITTQKCRVSLRKYLQTWKADLVLHDGAPNVGKSWIHDAFEQNRLVLSALHLACDFLVRGGSFVTKVFRSKDYNALIWVFNKLFKKVFATKPSASRNESAEIFVVCQNFIAPEKIDEKFFDPSHVFAELEANESKITPNDLLKASVKIKKPKAEGYEDGEILLYHKINASDLIASMNYADLLAKASEVILDTDFIKNHPSTTNEVKECLKDIKVLGRKELTLLINWRKDLKKDIRKQKGNEKPESGDSYQEQTSQDEKVNESAEEIDAFEDEEAQKLKKKRKKIAKERKKLAERMNLKMVIENDQLVQEEQDLFSLSRIKKVFPLDQIEEVEPDIVPDDDDGENVTDIKGKLIFYDKDSDDRYEDPDGSDVSDNEDEIEDLTSIDNAAKNQTKSNGTVIDFDVERSKMIKSISAELEESSESEDDELDQLPLKKRDRNFSSENGLDQETADSLKINPTKASRLITLNRDEKKLSSILIKSKKSQRDLIDDSWNRYMHDDFDGCPEWFRREEEKHCRKPLPITDEMKRKIKEQALKLNKKALEAKARKKKRALRRLEKARIKAESLTEDPNMSNKEKADTIKRIYKKATVKSDKRPQLVIAKKQYGNRRPPGVKGRYKIVDARMKKDQRKLQNAKKSKGNNKSKRKQKSK